MPHGLHRRAYSSGRGRHPLELNQAANVVNEVHHPNLEPRPRDADGAHDLAAHCALLVAEYVLNSGARHSLDVSAEILPWHDLLDRLQRIALGADRLQPALNIEKALLPHDSLAPSALPRAVTESDSRALGERNFSRRP